MCLTLALLEVGCDRASESTQKQSAPAEDSAASAPDDQVPDAEEPYAELLGRLRAAGHGAVELISTEEISSARQYWQFRLENGLTVILVRDGALPVLSYQTWFRVGSRHDPEGKEGLTHLFEHLMFRRTTDRRDGEFDQEMERRGIDPDATAWLDTTTYFQLIPPEELVFVASMEAERMTQIYIGEDVLDAERAVVMRERAYRVDNDPGGSMNETLYTLAFPDHPYRNPSVGKRASLESLTVEDLREVYSAYYQPSNAAIVLVGDLEVEAAMNAILPAYGGIESSAAPVDPISDAPILGGRNERTLLMPIDTEVLLMGFPCPNGRDPDYEVMEVINTILFADPHGQVFRQLRFEEELVASTQGWVGRFKDRSMFEILATMKRGVTHERPRQIILEALTRLAREGPDETALGRAKRRLELTWLRDIQSPAGLADELGGAWAIEADPRQVFRRAERYDAVSSEDVVRVAQTYLQPRYLVEVLGAPLEE